MEKWGGPKLRGKCKIERWNHFFKKKSPKTLDPVNFGFLDLGPFSLFFGLIALGKKKKKMEEKKVFEASYEPVNFLCPGYTSLEYELLKIPRIIIVLKTKFVTAPALGPCGFLLTV